jgi:hypothetical protein
MAVIEQERVVVAPDVPAELDEVGQVLVKAAEIVRRVNNIHAEAGTCASNALFDASGDWGFTPAHARLMESLGLSVCDVRNLFNWNDTPGRTPAEVADAMERAAWLS